MDVEHSTAGVEWLAADTLDITPGLVTLHGARPPPWNQPAFVTVEQRHTRVVVQVPPRVVARPVLLRPVRAHRRGRHPTRGCQPGPHQPPIPERARGCVSL